MTDGIQPAAVVVYCDPKRDGELDGVVILEWGFRELITRPRGAVCGWRGGLEHRMRFCDVYLCERNSRCTIRFT